MKKTSRMTTRTKNTTTSMTMNTGMMNTMKSMMILMMNTTTMSMKTTSKKTNSKMRSMTQKTAIGYLPTEDSLDLTGLDLPAEDKKTLLSVDTEGWKATLPQFKEWLDKLNKYGNMPKEIFDQFEALKARLG